MSTFVPSPTKGSRRRSSAAEDLDPDDYRQLMDQGRKLLQTVQRTDVNQNVWNEELRRCYRVEHKNEKNPRESRRDAERGDQDARKMTNVGFSRWLAKQNNALAVSTNDLGNWFHLENLAMRTPFAAVVPCPSKITDKALQLMESAMDGFGFSMFYVQTVPMSAMLSDISRAFVVSPAHVPEEVRASKSDLGAFSYVGTPCHCGADAVELIDRTSSLQEAVGRTPVLLLNDYCPRVPICMRVLVVAGKCVAAEVACDEAYTPLFGVTPNDGSGVRKGSRGRKARDSASSDEVIVTACDVLAYGVDNFVKDSLGEVLGARSYEAILLAEVKGFDPRVLGPGEGRPPFWPSLGNSDAARKQSPFSETGIRFYLVNVDEPNTVDFEIFSAEELRVISGYIHRVENNGDNSLPPVLRFLDGCTEKDFNDADTASSIALSADLKVSEKSAERRERKHGGKSSSKNARRYEDSSVQSDGDRARNGHHHRLSDDYSTSSRSHSRHDRDKKKDGKRGDKQADPRGSKSEVKPGRAGDSDKKREERTHSRRRDHTDSTPHSSNSHRMSSAASETSATSSRLPSRLSSFAGDADGGRARDSMVRKESIYTEERPQNQLHKDTANGHHRSPSDVDTQSTRSSRLPDRVSSVHRGSYTNTDAGDTQSTRSSLPARRGSQVIYATGQRTPEAPSRSATSTVSSETLSGRDRYGDANSASRNAKPLSESKMSLTKEDTAVSELQPRKNVAASDRASAHEKTEDESVRVDEASTRSGLGEREGGTPRSHTTESEKPEIEHDAEDTPSDEQLSSTHNADSYRQTAPWQGDYSWEDEHASRSSQHANHLHKASGRHSRPSSGASSPLAATDAGLHTARSGSVDSGRTSLSGPAGSDRRARAERPETAESDRGNRLASAKTSATTSSSNVAQVPVIAEVESAAMCETESTRFSSRTMELGQSSRHAGSSAGGSKAASQRVQSASMTSSRASALAHERCERGVDSATPVAAWSPSSSRISSTRGTPVTNTLHRKQQEHPQQQQQQQPSQAMQTPSCARTQETPAESPVPMAASIGQSTFLSPPSSAFRSAHSSRFTTPASQALANGRKDRGAESRPTASSYARSAATESEFGARETDQTMQQHAEVAGTESSTATGTMYDGKDMSNSHVHDPLDDDDDDAGGASDGVQQDLFSSGENGAAQRNGHAADDAGDFEDGGEDSHDRAVGESLDQDAEGTDDESGFRGDDELATISDSSRPAVEIVSESVHKYVEVETEVRSSHASLEPARVSYAHDDTEDDEEDSQNAAEETNSEEAGAVVEASDVTTRSVVREVVESHVVRATVIPVPSTEKTAPAVGSAEDELRRARLMALSAVVTANVALETILRLSKRTAN